MIKAPYNFVPLNEKVFFPPWADQVSHDIPFSDGESGEIEIKITAKSPIFISDGKDKEKFCNHNGTYYIPGSSVKGMIRNVLEIMSFSKMKFVDDKTYAVRDLSSADNFYMTEIKEDVLCGWLFYNDEGQLKIEDCGIPYRISYDKIENKFESFKKEYFLINEEDLQRKRFTREQKSNVNLGYFDNGNSPYKNAHEKYKLIGEDIVQNNTYHFSFLEEDEHGKEFVSFDEEGDIRGKLVLTGHPSARVENWDDNDTHTIRPTGKINDFVFEEYIDDEKAYFSVKNEVFENFKFAYFDGKSNESEDWKYWRNKLLLGQKIPIFFQVSEKNDKRFVKHFGLSYLYKLPYKHTILRGLNENHLAQKQDLSEVIFGSISDENSLKGRVHVSHLVTLNAQEEINSVKYNLLNPRASYYPIYIRQNGMVCSVSVDNYATYMDNDFVLSGWKRYPIHIQPNIQRGNCHENDTISTCFKPLRRDSIFIGKIRFHNLKKAEIGALLSAITFHNTSNTFHNIGLAKAYGFGKVDMEITNTTLEESKVEYLLAYEKLMNLNIDNWSNTIQLKELITMATEQNDNNLEFMDVSGRDNSYASNKNIKNYLCLYSQLNNVEIKQVNSLFENDNYTLDDLVNFLGKNAEEVSNFIENESINAETISLDIAKSIMEYI